MEDKAIENFGELEAGLGCFNCKISAIERIAAHETQNSCANWVIGII